MIFISILTLIVAKALPLLNKQISSIHFTRIASIIFIYTGAITLNCLYIQSIGSGIGIYSGLFHITQISQLIEIFLFIIGGLILIGWPQVLPPLIEGSDRQEVVIKPIKKNISYLSSATSPEQQSLENASARLAFGCFKPDILITSTPAVAPEARVENYSTDYSIIVLFSILGSSLLISSFDLISLYLSIELQSFGLYVLSTLYRDSESSTSAGLKYFLLGAFSSCLILLGSGLIYSYTGVTNFESLYLLNSISDIDQQYVIQGLSLGLIIIFVGFLFKIAAAPLHNWSPDVYDGTPTIVTTWLTIIPKISILILLLELQSQIGIIGGIKTKILSSNGYLTTLASASLRAEVVENMPSLLSTEGLVFLSNTVSASLAPVLVIGLPVLKTLLLISSILSLIIGSLLGLAQIRIKRLLAYSTISHVGFLLLALAINTEQSIDSFLFYLIQYTITNLNIFLIILALTYILYAPAHSTHKCRPAEPASKGCHGNERYSQSDELNFFDLKNNIGNIRDIRYISELKGLFFSNPLLSLSLGICLFSMAGIPPLIGFFSKQFVLYSALQNGYYFISLIAIIVSVISASYYLKIIKILHTPLLVASQPLPKAQAIGGQEFESNVVEDNKAPKLLAKVENLHTTSWPMPEGAPQEAEPFEDNNLDPFIFTTWARPEAEAQNKYTLTNTHSFLISSLTLIILLFFIKPSIILNSTQLLSLSLFYI
jgi:NADH-ubiquinone oxidoreductase chain 2